MSENLIHQRQAIQHLLDLHAPADALTAYYALHHPEQKTTLIVHHDDHGRADGFLSLARTGIDLFRPLLTMKAASIEVAGELLQASLPPQAAVIIAVPASLQPAIEAFFTVSGETVAHVLKLERADFRPVINVLVTRAPTPSGDPRFVIRGQSFDRGARPVGPILAGAGINWRSPHFGDIYVNTDPQARGRGFGKSVVSALSSWLLDQNLTPLYTISPGNAVSDKLATSLGYRDSGVRLFLGDGVRR